MGIYYRAHLIRLDATRQGTWVASVTPFRSGGQPFDSGPTTGEVVGEFGRREEAIAAAQARIDGGALSPPGGKLSRPREADRIREQPPAGSMDAPGEPNPAALRRGGGQAPRCVPPDILVIDDDTLTRWSLRQVLGRAGYRVRVAASAAEGLAHARQVPPDLVLLDVQLPDADGGSVLQAFQQSCPELPVVMMSADATPETVRHLRRLGACDFLTKPCASVLLLTLVASLL